MLKTLIEANMVSPDGVWNPVVNPEWLISKKQKTYQICIQPIYGESDMAEFGMGTQIAMTSSQFMAITLFAPSRIGVWNMFIKMKDLLNNGTLVAPTAGIDDYHYIIIRRTDSTKPVMLYDPNCGPQGSNENCIGFRIDISVEIRWEE
tara:strand:- start:11241 stop:11684 length:444 start_codon:yes stop_codon:yes gene_type:complete